MSKKPIIVFEGIEGTGKSYHIKKIANYLTRKKIKFIKIREPGGSTNSEKIRNLILDNKSTFNKETDLLLYLSARSENMEIIKQNAGKKIILIDRFSDSTIAYQHYGMGVNLKFIQNINNHLLRNIKIDFTFLNTVNLSNMKKRLRLRKKLNRYDKFDIKFYEKVQNGFIKILKKNPKKYIKINSNLDIDLNESIILNKINDLI
ncbi:dTMP kinase [Candidatus Pelagibacter giovannonii]|uniref:Thymidylate kinase n=1 Tax=Candidatus Pelagibacter giovannonii TaxID=2563896 RepID=A0A6H1Q1W9_9PROT|nr:dTMP kinase [Candidatus Pelagibacter giovannonii]QIZ20373.1 dTMP kinase [Candidatus Pelagibacter giovannonii]